MPGPYIYENVDKLEGAEKVSTESCATLVQYYTKVGKAANWKEGDKVKGNAKIKKGTAVATFENGKYPNRKSGNHAAFYMSQNSAGILVMDQWNGPSKPKISSRTMRFKGTDDDGNYIDPSNNGDALSVIMT